MHEFYPQENTHSERKDRYVAQISNSDETYPLGLSLMNEKEKKATARYQQLFTLFQEMFLFFVFLFIFINFFFFARLSIDVGLMQLSFTIFYWKFVFMAVFLVAICYSAHLIRLISLFILAF